MNKFTLQWIKKKRFSKLGYIQDLSDEKSKKNIEKKKRIIEKKKGIYLVVTDPKKKHSFKKHHGKYKGKVLDYEEKILKKKWVDKASVLYIGKAGTLHGKATLYSRLKQYIDFDENKKSPHRGGRAIWQLNDKDELIIYWKVLEDDENPRIEEKKLIEEFVKSHKDKLPFANWRK